MTRPKTAQIAARLPAPPAKAGRTTLQWRAATRDAGRQRRRQGPEPARMTTHDIVLRGGRVIDPQTGRDHIADVAISGASIAEVGDALTPGAVDIDVTGQVV